jgi:hypothetical protein
MGRLSTILGVVLAVQLGLAAVLAFSEPSIGALRPGQPLLQFDPAKVDRVMIAGPKGAPLVLARRNGKWRLPSRFGFPAANDKVEAFVTSLAGLKPRLPVATTADAAARFEVDRTDFRRKVTVKSGKRTVATLFLGKADGARRSYARAHGSHAVYQVELGTYRASVEARDWRDPDFLHVDVSRIRRLHLPEATIEHDKQHWRIDGLKAKQTTNEAAAAALVDQLTNLSYRSVLGTHDQAAYSQAKPVLRCTLDLTSGKHRTYIFSKPGKGKGYVLKLSDQPFYLKVPGEAVSRLVKTTRGQLVQVDRAAGKPNHAQPKSAASDTSG